jgi:hypothetical protein
VRISEIAWTDADVEHIARHAIAPEEVDEVIASGPLWRRGRQDRQTGQMSVYAFGRTEAGRYLFIVLSPLGLGRARCITAREMDTRMRGSYDQHRR